ncbi:MAG: hypothetical protein WCB67_08890 [Solirubrobacteraceae bacterium]
MTTLTELVLGPVLAAGSTLAVRRWGPHLGGVVSAFPAIVGPVLLILTLEHGGAFAARAAAGTLLGLLTLSAFALAYGGYAARYGWRASLAAGWTAAALTGAGLGLGVEGTSLPTALAVATGSLLVAWRVLARSGRGSLAAKLTDSATRPGALVGIPSRMVMTAMLVIALSAASVALGPLVGGMLAALPVVASLMVVLTHREAGGEAAISLLRGTITGMGGFLVFCAVIALLIAHHPTFSTFLIATATAVGAQAGAVAVGRHTGRSSIAGLRTSHAGSAATRDRTRPHPD